jgi:hypothetical protein
MAASFRRAVTGRDKDGRAICVSDNIATNILQRPNRPGVTLAKFWQCATTVAEYDGDEETVYALKKFGRLGSLSQRRSYLVDAIAKNSGDST